MHQSFGRTNKVPLKCKRRWVLLGLIKYNLIGKIWLVMTSFWFFQKVMTIKFYCMESYDFCFVFNLRLRKVWEKQGVVTEQNDMLRMDPGREPLWAHAVKGLFT